MSQKLSVRSARQGELKSGDLCPSLCASTGIVCNVNPLSAKQSKTEQNDVMFTSMAVHKP